MACSSIQTWRIEVQTWRIEVQTWRTVVQTWRIIVQTWRIVVQTWRLNKYRNQNIKNIARDIESRGLVFRARRPIRKKQSCFPPTRGLRSTRWMFRCLNCNVSDLFKKYFIKTCHMHFTRGNGVDLITHKISTEVARRSLYYQGAVEFNRLPTSVKQNSSITVFKSRLTDIFQMPSAN